LIFYVGLVVVDVVVVVKQFATKLQNITASDGFELIILIKFCTIVVGSSASSILSKATLTVSLLSIPVFGRLGPSYTVLLVGQQPLGMSAQLAG
jgi:hypothetical protein